ncbi:MAG: hypothetical protein V3T72_16030 [Thermoanaerobaculia bacterium]
MASLLAFGLLSIAGPAAGRGGIEKASFDFDLEVLAPEHRASLEAIRVLFLEDDNLETVWKLQEQPDLVDVIVVSCSPKCLSSDVLEAVAEWAKLGHGVFLGAPALYPASRFLLPEGHFVKPHELEIPTGHWWLARDSPLTENVGQVRHELWCSRDNTSTLGLGFDDPLSPVSAEAALADASETFLPLVSWKRHLRDDDEKMLVPQARRHVMLASTYQGARVIWYAYDLDPEKKKCQPQYDDVRLWSNLVHWLAAGE